MAKQTEDKKVYAFPRAGSVKINYTLALWSQGNEFTGKGNETKQQRKNWSVCL